MNYLIKKIIKKNVKLYIKKLNKINNNQNNNNFKINKFRKTHSKKIHSTYNKNFIKKKSSASNFPIIRVARKRKSLRGQSKFALKTFIENLDKVRHKARYNPLK